MFLKYINIPIFLICLALGLLFVYLNAPDNRVVIVYPTPENTDKIQYKDYASNCYEFKAVEMECPSDNSEIKEIPVQSL